jgi:hypothetical protein
MEMKALSIFLTLVLGVAAASWGLETRTVRMSSSDLSRIAGVGPATAPSCTLRYYYMIEYCALVSVATSLEENQTVGTRFNMADSVAWHIPCDTSACLTLDAIKIVLYDVLPSPNDQSMNLQVYATDQSGHILGDALGNVDFSPAYTGAGSFSASLIDFTNDGAVPGLDLSGCGGHCVALLTWKNATGHPGLVLDVVSACVEACVTGNPACCKMGTPPYTYPRTMPNTYDYGYGVEPGEPKPICDPAEPGESCPTWGYVEALWEAYFCSVSASLESTTWGAIKTLYR